jgi:hypothetical protein
VRITAPVKPRLPLARYPGFTLMPGLAESHCNWQRWGSDCCMTGGALPCIGGDTGSTCVSAVQGSSITEAPLLVPVLHSVI